MILNDTIYLVNTKNTSPFLLFNTKHLLNKYSVAPKMDSLPTSIL